MTDDEIAASVARIRLLKATAAWTDDRLAQSKNAERVLVEEIERAAGLLLKALRGTV